MITTIITYIPTIAEYYFYYKMLDFGIKCASYLNLTVSTGKQIRRMFSRRNVKEVDI